MSKKVNNRLLLVNYHYIRDPDQYPYAGIHPLTLNEFRQQVEWLAARYCFVSPEEAEGFALGEETFSRPGVLLTFDDGLIDHSRAAQEVLDPLGIKAVFFVCSCPLIEKRPLMVHKVHWLRATTKPEVFYRELVELLPDQWRDYSLTEQEQSEACRIYIYDTKCVAYLKFLINFVLPAHVVDFATARMLEARGISNVEFCERTYMKESDLLALTKRGHLIGAHTHTHEPVTRLNKLEQENIESNIKALTQCIRKPPTWFSYPYGRDWAIPKDSETFCRRYGFKIGVSLKGQWNTIGQSPYELNRINTNDVEDVCT